MRAGLRPLGIGEGATTLPTQGGFITENRNFQLAHHVTEALRERPTEKLIVLTGANHAGFSQDTFQGLQVLVRTHPVPDIPTFVRRSLPQVKMTTAIFEGNKPARTVFNTPQGPITLASVKDEVAKIGAGAETFMVAVPTVYEDQELTDWERRYDYYVHLPQRPVES